MITVNTITIVKFSFLKFSLLVYKVQLSFIDKYLAMIFPYFRENTNTNFLT